MTAVPSQVRSEGLTERMGDILLDCSGSNPGAVLTGNFSVYLPVSISNRVDSTNRTNDAVLYVDYGTGFVPTGVPGQISGQIIAFNGINVIIPPSGNLKLKISNIRADVSQFGNSVPQQVLGQIIFGTPSSILVNQSQLTVAFAQPGLFTQMSNRGIINCAGSSLPTIVTLFNLFEAETTFASTRVTEGFASAFQPRGQGDDSGTRFLVKYSGFPSGARLYLPDFVAGSNAAVPTAGGDLGIPQQVGQYVPGSGTLLLSRVQNADANGAGGFPSGALGLGALNSVSEVPLTGGSGYAVYEVVDANSALQESAQFPTFVGITDVTAPAVAHETISFAPVSTIRTASTSAPVPRFANLPSASDCNILRDCTANYYPHISVLPNPVNLTAIATGAMTSQPGYIAINNSGGGVMPWAAIIRYTTGSGWLTLDYASGVNNGSVRLWAKPQGLAAGTYTANVLIDAGLAGTATIPVTLVVQPAPVLPPVTPPAPVIPATPPVTVSNMVNAATFQVTPMVPGSLGTLMGSNLAGKAVEVTFDGLISDLLYTSGNQINLRVPAALGSKTSAQVVVTVDGNKSAPYTVALAPAWPSVFSNGVFNQDNSPNGNDRAAARGSILQIFATGIPANATVSATIGDRENLVPLYAGAAPTAPGVQQVNVAIPEDFTGSRVRLSVCASIGDRQYCSADYSLVVQ